MIQRYIQKHRNNIFLLKQMSYIYILSNKGMPNLVKIGFTTFLVYIRARQLFTTGVPFPFDIEAYWKIPSRILQIRETQIKDILKKYRAHPKREFYWLSVEQAKQQISEYLHEKDILEKQLLKQKNERFKKIKAAEKAKKDEDIQVRNIQEFVDILNSKTNEIGRYIEKYLSPKVATKTLAERRNERLISHGEWLIIASHSYCGSSEKSHYLSKDNLILYMSVPAKTRKHFRTKDYPSGYFEFGYQLHSGELIYPSFFTNSQETREIITDVNLPYYLPDFLQNAGLLALSRDWKRIFV